MNAAQEEDRGDLPWIAATGGYAALVGAGVGGASGDVIAAVLTPGLVVATEAALREWHGRRLARGGAVLGHAARLLDENIDDVGRRITKDPGLQTLAGEAIVAGSVTLVDAKILALARALANGVQDSARVDIERMIVAALGDMEVPHVRVLRYMAQNYLGDGELVMHTLFGLANSLPGYSPDVIHVIIGTFERHGLVFPRPIDYAQIISPMFDAGDISDTPRSNWLETPPPAWHLSQIGLDVDRYLLDLT